MKKYGRLLSAWLSLVVNLVKILMRKYAHLHGISGKEEKVVERCEEEGGGCIQRQIRTHDRSSTNTVPTR